MRVKDGAWPVAARTRWDSKKKVARTSGRGFGGLDRDGGAGHRNREPQRSDGVGKGGAPRLAAFPIDGNRLVDRFGENDLIGGGNDLADDEAQGRLVAKADDNGLPGMRVCVARL